MASLKRDVASGLVIVAPIAITLLAIQFLIRFIAGMPLVGAVEPWWVRVPVAIAVFVVLAMSIGYLMRTALGALVEDLIIASINQLPVIRVFYNAVRLGVETALRSGEGRIEPVRVEAWSGLRVTAFASGHRTSDGRLICFLPTAPNITTGYVIEVAEEDVRRTGETLEEALTRIISAGFGERDDGPQGTTPFGDGRPTGRVRGVRTGSTGDT